MSGFRLSSGGGRFAAYLVTAVGCLVMIVSGCSSWQGAGWEPSDYLKIPFLSGDSGQTSAEGQHAAGDSANPNRAFLEQMEHGRSLEKAGRIEQARAVYRRLVAEYPKRCEPYHRLGVMADRQNRHTEARAMFDQALQRDANNPEVLNSMGYCLYEQVKLAEAETALRKAVSLATANHRYRNNLAMVLGRQGHYREAMDHFRQTGSEADAFYNLAYVMASQGDQDAAKNYLRLALDADPTHQRARDDLNALNPRIGPQTAPAARAVMEMGILWVPYVEGDRSTAVSPPAVAHKDSKSPPPIPPPIAGLLIPDRASRNHLPPSGLMLLPADGRSSR